MCGRVNLSTTPLGGSRLDRVATAWRLTVGPCGDRLVQTGVPGGTELHALRVLEAHDPLTHELDACRVVWRP